MDANDYQNQSAVTLSNRLHGEKVTMAELRGRIQRVIDAGNALDQVKKALFYGKGDDLGLTNSIGARNAIEAPFLIAGVDIPLLTADLTAEEKARVEQAEVLLHMALGMVTEGVEFLEGVFKAMNGEAPPDRINLLEEIGDIAWYQANALTALGSDFPTEFRRNNTKLRLRFPAGFTEHDAINRDLFSERETLEAEPKAAGVGNEWHEPEADRAERFAIRCPECGLAHSQHRPACSHNG